MKWKLTTKVFIAPDTFPAGAVIEYHGTPGIAFEPVDDEARAVWDKWAEANPGKVGHRPFDELEIVSPTASMVTPPESEAAPEGSQLGVPQKAKPGLSGGGKALKVASNG
jgi:hypothetical protein